MKMKTILTNGHKIDLTIELKHDIEIIYYDGKEISTKKSSLGGIHIFEVIENDSVANYEIEYAPHKSMKEIWNTVRRNGIIVFTDKDTGENQKEVKTSNKNVVYVFILLGIALFFYYQGFFGPKGDIVADRADNSSSSLGEYSYRIVATVLNNGRSGEITLTADLKQGGNLWRKELKKTILSNQVEEFVIDFDEPTLFGGDVSYSLKCTP